jgi:hypothetical protein
MIGASTTPISLSARLGAGSRAFADYRVFRNSSTRSSTNSLSSALFGSRLVENGRLLSLPTMMRWGSTTSTSSILRRYFLPRYVLAMKVG